MHPTIPDSLAKLFRNWFSSPVPDEGKLAYAEACQGRDARDVADAVQRLVTGKVKRAYPDLIPSPAVLATEIVKSRDARLDEEARMAPKLPPPPMPVYSAEEVARRKAAVADILARHGMVKRLSRVPTAEEHEEAKRRAIAEIMATESPEYLERFDKVPDRKYA